MITKIKLPALLLAHDLRSGKVLYWHKGGWLAALRSPVIADNETAAKYLFEIGKSETDKNNVVDAGLEEIIIGENNQINFRHFRERIKQNGPTINYGEINV